MAVARSSDDNAVRYVLPVLWMTPCFHIIGKIQIQTWSLRRSELFTATLQVAPLNCRYGGEVRCRRLPCRRCVIVTLTTTGVDLSQVRRDSHAPLESCGFLNNSNFTCAVTLTFFVHADAGNCDDFFSSLVYRLETVSENLAYLSAARQRGITASPPSCTVRSLNLLTLFTDK